MEVEDLFLGDNLMLLRLCSMTSYGPLGVELVGLVLGRIELQQDELAGLVALLCCFCDGGAALLD